MAYRQDHAIDDLITTRDGESAWFTAAASARGDSGAAPRPAPHRPPPARRSAPPAPPPLPPRGVGPPPVAAAIEEPWRDPRSPRSPRRGHAPTIEDARLAIASGAPGDLDTQVTLRWSPVVPEPTLRDHAERPWLAPGPGEPAPIRRAVDRRLSEHYVPTVPMAAQRGRAPSRLIVPALGLTLAGVLIGGLYVLVSGGQRAAAAAARPPAQAELSQAVAVTAATAEPPREPRVDVHVDSTPPGAMVMLVDRGQARFAGSTPLTASLDPAQEYDLVLTCPSCATRVEHIAPRATQRVVVALGPAATPAPALAEVAAAPTPPAATPAPAAAPTPPAATPAPAAAPKPPATYAKRPRPVTRPAPRHAGEGTLMISAKPPCEILIDGEPTGLTTPQRAIPLRAGRHRITLVNREQDLEKTVAIQIEAGETEKVIQDLLQPRAGFALEP